MKTSQIALNLYIVSCFLAVLATILHNDILILLAKPTVIPAIFFYYLAVKKATINWVFVAVLILNFIGDTIVLLELENQTLIIMIPYFLGYLLLLFFAIQDVKRMKFNASALILSVIIFGFLMYVLYALIQLFVDSNKELVLPVLIYGIVLATLGSIAVYCYYTKSAAFTFYLLMTALTSIVSDVFYMMFNFIFHISYLNYFEFAVQLVSYYFIVKYFVLRKT